MERDGRSARRDRNRVAVVDAVIDILNEGALEMSIAEVTERSGVSERSIFRYFASLDDLRNAVFLRSMDSVRSTFDTDPPDTPLATRVERLVARRIEMYESIPGVQRVVRARELEVPSIAEHVAESRERLCGQIRQQFTPELTRLTRARASDLVTLIAVLVSFPSWDLYSRAYGRSRAQIRRAWISALGRLVAEA